MTQSMAGDLLIASEWIAGSGPALRSTNPATIMVGKVAATIDAWRERHHDRLVPLPLKLSHHHASTTLKRGWSATAQSRRHAPPIARIMSYAHSQSSSSVKCNPPQAKSARTSKDSVAEAMTKSPRLPEMIAAFKRKASERASFAASSPNPS